MKIVVDFFFKWSHSICFGGCGKWDEMRTGHMLEKERRPPSPDAGQCLLSCLLMEQSLKWAYGVSKNSTSLKYSLERIYTQEYMHWYNPHNSELQVTVNIWCRLHVFHTLSCLTGVMKF